MQLYWKVTKADGVVCEAGPETIPRGGTSVPLEGGTGSSPRFLAPSKWASVKLDYKVWVPSAETQKDTWFFLGVTSS